MKYGLYYLGAVVSFLLVLITAASGDYILAAVFGAHHLAHIGTALPLFIQIFQ